MDLALFRLLNGLAGHGAPWDAIIVFCASYLQYVLGALLVALCAWPSRRIRIFTAALGAAAVARLAVKPIILMFVHRARPYTVIAGVSNIVGPQVGEELQSMPSGHTLFFFALAMAVYRYNKRWGTVFFAGAFLMSVARVVGGIHWPSDVVVGALVGIVVGWNTVQWVPWFKKALPYSA